MTALYPYGKVRLGNRMDAWTLGGVGWGELTIKEGGGQPLETDLGMTMGAIGVGGQIPEAPNGDVIDLRAKSDAMCVRMKSEELTGDNGNHRALREAPLSAARAADSARWLHRGRGQRPACRHKRGRSGHALGMDPILGNLDGGAVQGGRRTSRSSSAWTPFHVVRPCHAVGAGPPNFRVAAPRRSLDGPKRETGRNAQRGRKRRGRNG